MKPLPWFRWDTSAVDNDKLRLLSFDDRWHFVALCCCKAQGILDIEAPRSMILRRIAVKLGVQAVDLDEILRRLDEVGLIDRKKLLILKWNERQFISDHSNDRVSKYRKNKKTGNGDKPLLKRFETVTVTAPDTDTDTDTEEEKEGRVRDPNFESHDKPEKPRLSPPLSDQREKAKAERETATKIIELLNIRAGRNFRVDETNTKLIICRLREGYTEAELRSVIVRKVAAWLPDPKMAQYLRPVTLFGKTNCAQYVGEKCDRPPMFVDEYRKFQETKKGNDNG